MNGYCEIYCKTLNSFKENERKSFQVIVNGTRENSRRQGCCVYRYWD